MKFGLLRSFGKFDLGSGHGLTGKGHAAYQLIRIAELNTSDMFYRSSTSVVSYINSKEIVLKKLLVTLHDLR